MGRVRQLGSSLADSKRVTVWHLVILTYQADVRISIGARGIRCRAHLCHYNASRAPLVAALGMP